MMINKTDRNDAMGPAQIMRTGWFRAVRVKSAPRHLARALPTSRGLSVWAAIDDPSRFARSAAVGADFGLTPRRHASGEIDRSGRISKRGDRDPRTHLHETANVPLARISRASALGGLGAEDRQTIGVQEGRSRRRPQNGGHPSPHVDRRCDVPARTERRSGVSPKILRHPSSVRPRRDEGRSEVVPTHAVLADKLGGQRGHHIDPFKSSKAMLSAVTPTTWRTMRPAV